MSSSSSNIYKAPRGSRQTDNDTTADKDTKEIMELLKKHQITKKSLSALLDGQKKFIQVHAPALMEIHPDSALFCFFKSNSTLKNNKANMPMHLNLLKSNQMKLKIMCRRSVSNEIEGDSKFLRKCLIGSPKKHDDFIYSLTVSIYSNKIPESLKEIINKWKSSTNGREWRSFRPTDVAFPEGWELRFSDRKKDGQEKTYWVLVFFKNVVRQNQTLRVEVAFHFDKDSSQEANQDFDEYMKLAGTLFEEPIEYFTEFKEVADPKNWSDPTEYSEFVHKSIQVCQGLQHSLQHSYPTRFERFITFM